MLSKLIESSYLARYFLLNAVDITDYKVFPAREIENAAPLYDFSPCENGQAILATPNPLVRANARQRQLETIDHFLERHGTTALLVVRGESLLCERYYHGYQRTSTCTSFSTAKSFVSALVGIALQENVFQHIDDPISLYLPELTAPFWSAISIRHLVSMSSGLRYDANGFLPWNDEPRVYYSPNLRELVKQVQPVEKPGMRFHYNNYNLILLGMMLERASGGTVSAYLQEKIWKPLGMEGSASWSLDSEQHGMEKMESGLNARAIDFAKFGRLYLRRGDWNGKQIIPESWVVESTSVTADAKWTNYKYLWWISRTGAGRFTAVGNLGQFIFIAPDKDCVIVRFGRGKPHDWKTVYPRLFGAIADML